jgi:hypothetical protein
MPANEINSNATVFTNEFKSGKYLGVKLSDDKDGNLRLFENFSNLKSVYFRESKEILRSLVRLIDNGIDFRSIFFLMITFNKAVLAQDLLKYLESNNIFFPIDTPYHSPDLCPHFFAEVASLGEPGVTKSLFKYGVSGYKKQLKNYDLTEKEIKEKIDEFVEELFVLTPSSLKISTLEYVVFTVSQVTLINEGFCDIENKKEQLNLLALAYSRTDSFAAKEVELTYNLPWDTMKVLVELGVQYNINLTATESIYFSPGNKIFDIITKAADDKEAMSKLVNGFIYPYSKSSYQIVELKAFVDNLEDYYFMVDIDGMHYDGKPSEVLIKIDTMFIKSRCEVVLAIKPQLSQDVVEILEQQSINMRLQNDRLRAHSVDIKEHTVTLEQHSNDIAIIKIDIEDLKKASEQIKKIIQTNLADNLIFENIGDNQFLKKLYIDIRDVILEKLNAALQGKDGDLDKQMALILKNGAVLAGTLDFAAGFAGAPGVIGVSFGIIAYACKYFEKLHEQKISSEMKEMLLGSLDLPKLIAVGVAEALVLKAKENIHDRQYKQAEQKHIIKCIDDLVSRQLSGAHLNKLFELMLDVKYNPAIGKQDIFVDLKQMLIATIIAGRPFTSHLLVEDNIVKDIKLNTLKHRIITSFSQKHKNHSINHHAHGADAMVRELFNPARTNPDNVDQLNIAKINITESGGGNGHSNCTLAKSQNIENKSFKL